jgi:glycosyltransferase involved in cell wall biosynthesis
LIDNSVHPAITYGRSSVFLARPRGATASRHHDTQAPDEITPTTPRAPRGVNAPSVTATGDAVWPDPLGTADGRQRPVTLDIVIPVYNEAAALPELLRALAETFTLEVCARRRIAAVRCLFVDDGSVDESVQILRRHPASAFQMQIIRLSRNFGHQAAITAGLADATADLVTVMDADLQDPPACVLEMIEKWRDGFEVVYAERQNRKEDRLKVVLYWLFYRLYRVLTPILVPVDSGDFCLLSRRAVEELNKLPEKVRFPRGLRSWIGFRQTAIRYDRPPRVAGTSRYGWSDLYHLATDGIASLSLRPLQLAQVLALVYFLLSLVGLCAMMSRSFELDVSARISLLLMLTLLSNGLIMFCLYIVGAYLGRAYLEVKGRPAYVVAEVIVTQPGGDR